MRLQFFHPKSAKRHTVSISLWELSKNLQRVGNATAHAFNHNGISYACTWTLSLSPPPPLPKIIRHIRIFIYFILFIKCFCTRTNRQNNNNNNNMFLIFVFFFSFYTKSLNKSEMYKQLSSFTKREIDTFFVHFQLAIIFFAYRRPRDQILANFSPLLILLATTTPRVNDQYRDVFAVRTPKIRAP